MSAAGRAASSRSSTIPPGRGLPLLFQHVPEGKIVKNRVHLDLTAPDMPGEVHRLVRARRARPARVSEGARTGP